MNADCASRHTAGYSRRTFLHTAAATAFGAIATNVALTRPAAAQTSMTPDAALRALSDGNARYVARHLQSFAEDLSVLRDRTETKQEPFAAILSCADSRVPVEVIFDQSIGHLFVTRVAGNVATPEIIASLEYGAAVLGTPLIMVLGHAHCGAVKAAIGGNEVPGQISTLYAPLRQAVDLAGPDLERTIKANALIQAKLLGSASPALSGMIRTGKLKIVAGFYDLASGKVEVLR